VARIVSVCGVLCAFCFCFCVFVCVCVVIFVFMPCFFYFLCFLRRVLLPSLFRFLCLFCTRSVLCRNRNSATHTSKHSHTGTHAQHFLTVLQGTTRSLTCVTAVLSAGNYTAALCSPIWTPGCGQFPDQGGQSGHRVPKLGRTVVAPVPLLVLALFSSFLCFSAVSLVSVHASKDPKQHFLEILVSDRSA